MSAPRRGWRETIEPGLYRAHRVGCASTKDEKEGRRCGCVLQIKAPGSRPGTTRLVSIDGTLTEARALRRRLMAEGRPQGALEPEWEGTLTEFAAKYLRARSAVLAASTIRGYDQAYRHKIAPALGELQVPELTRARIEVWLADLASRDSAHAVWKATSTLRGMLRVAVDWHVIPLNPAAGLRLPKRPADATPAPERVLDEGQLAALFAATSSNVRLETLFRMAGEAGLRRGELLGLRWPDLDLAERRVTVARAVWQQPGRDGAPPTRIVKVPKSGKARRVAISPTLAARLGDWYAESVIERGTSAEGYVWPGQSGGPMESSTPSQALSRVLDRAGLVANPNPRPKGERPRGLVTLHGLRHTAASIMLTRGVPLLIVSRQLGHANPNITAAVYAHLLSDSQLDDAAAVFEPAVGHER